MAVRIRCDAPPSTAGHSWHCNRGNRTACFLLLKLQAVERRIAATRAKQFFVPPRLDCASVFDHVDAVGMRHRMESVCDDKSSATLAEMFHGFADLQFGFGIECRRCFVEQNN